MIKTNIPNLGQSSQGSDSFTQLHMYPAWIVMTLSLGWRSTYWIQHLHIFKFFHYNVQITSFVCGLTPALMTLVRDNRVRGALRRTRTGDNLCLNLGQSSQFHPPPGPGSAQTAGSPSTAPARSLRSEINWAQQKNRQTCFCITQSLDAL